MKYDATILKLNGCLLKFMICNQWCWKVKNIGGASTHELQTPREEIAITARPKIHSHSQIFRYGRSIFCLPHRPHFSDIFDLCLLWVSVVRASVSLHNIQGFRHWLLHSTFWFVTAIKIVHIWYKKRWESIIKRLTNSLYHILKIFICHRLKFIFQ